MLSLFLFFLGFLFLMCELLGLLITYLVFGLGEKESLNLNNLMPTSLFLTISLLLLVLFPNLLTLIYPIFASKLIKPWPYFPTSSNSST